MPAMGEFVGVRGVGACSTSTVAKRLDSGRSCFCTIRRSHFWRNALDAPAIVAVKPVISTIGLSRTCGLAYLATGMSKIHYTQEGESVGSIARTYGFPSHKAIYEHSANGELKRRRPDPNLLLPGDPVAIPDAIPRVLTCPIDQWHEETVEPEVPVLRLKLLDLSGKALPNQDYCLRVAGRERFGTTDGSGMLEEPMEYGTRSAVLSTTVTLGEEPKELVWKLQFSSLDPKGSVTGLQGRLCNLGYYQGEIDGCYGPATRGAVVAFQNSAGLTSTGVADDETWSALERLHDEST